MRLWMDSHGALIDDERVLATIAQHGSMSAALEAGDITLVHGTRDFDLHDSHLADEGFMSRSYSESPKLANYLHEE